MPRKPKASYLEIEKQLLDRIYRKEWASGCLLPSEMELARTFGCARATVSRALNKLAEAGVVTRKRRAGTRVSEAPDKYFRYKVKTAREQIESAGYLYHIKQIKRQYFVAPPSDLLAMTGINPDHEMLALICLHFADDRAFLLEQRWFDATLLSHAVDLDFNKVASEDWLASEYPFRNADYQLRAVQAEDELATMLRVKNKAALLQTDVTVRLGAEIISFVRLTNHPDHVIRASY